MKFSRTSTFSMVLAVNRVTLFATFVLTASLASEIQVGNGQYFNNCDYFVRLDANEGTSVINPGGYISILGYFGYLGFFDPGSSCRYFIECPQNYVIRLYCYVNIAVTGDGNSCKTEQFRVLDDGTNQILDRGTYFCGQGPVTFESRTNYIAFGHTSTYYSGRYNCTLISLYHNHPLNT